MAGSVIETRTFGDDSRTVNSRINRIALAWRSDASGAVSISTGVVNGTLVKIQFKPDAGANQPSDLYDVTLLDALGIDVLSGQGANLSNSLATAICPGVSFKDGTTTSSVPCCVDENLTLTIANAGNAKSGQVILYVR